MSDTTKPLAVEILHKLRHVNAVFRRKCPPPPHDGRIPPEGAEPPRGFGIGRLLGILSETEEGLSQAKLASLLNIRPQSLSELLNRLENDGFVRREQSEADKRQILVSITPEGLAHHTQMRSRHRREAEQLLSPLNETEKQTLLALLEKITQQEISTQRSDCE